MNKGLSLIFDVGTQATRALVIDTAGNVLVNIKEKGELYISDSNQYAEKSCESFWNEICNVSLKASDGMI